MGFFLCPMRTPLLQRNQGHRNLRRNRTFPCQQTNANQKNPPRGQGWARLLSEKYSRPQQSPIRIRDRERTVSSAPRERERESCLAPGKVLVYISTTSNKTKTKIWNWRSYPKWNHAMQLVSTATKSHQFLRYASSTSSSSPCPPI